MSVDAPTSSVQTGDKTATNSKKVPGRSVDLSTLGEDELRVDITDALSEKDQVKFTVHVCTRLQTFKKPELSVVREHHEFIWLHDAIEENEEYAGFIIPPAPPRPDFEASREKLTRLSEGESHMTKDEYNKLKKELEAEYLAQFKKTVAQHEVFLQRLAQHPEMRKDLNFHVFLTYEHDLAVRSKNTKEKVGSFWKRMTQSADEFLLSGQKDVDDWFVFESNYVAELHNHLASCTGKADRTTRMHKTLADSYIRVAANLEKMVMLEREQSLQNTTIKTIETLETSRKFDAKATADEDLKLSDLLRYYMRDTEAAKDLVYRRLRALADYEAANKALERARTKNRDVHKAEADQTAACEKFEKLSEVAKSDLEAFKTRRVHAFKKNLVELAELQLKHARSHAALLKAASEQLKVAAGEPASADSNTADM